MPSSDTSESIGPCNVVIVEDRGTRWLSKWITGGHSIEAEDLSNHSIDEICVVLLERIRAKKPDLLVVCAEWKPYPDACRSNQHGVTLLKHLRLGSCPDPETDGTRHTHMVVCSWEPVEELIRRKPGNTILLSDGVTFLRLPEGLDRLADATFLDARARASATVSKKYLRPYIASDYDPPDSAHAMSNWWGVRQFYTGRRKMRSEEEPELPPEPVQSELQKLSNKQALFLCGEEYDGVNQGDPAFGPETDMAELLVVEQVLRERFASAPIPKIVLVDDEANLGWADILRRALYGITAPPDCLHVVPIPKTALALDADWVRANITSHDPD